MSNNKKILIASIIAVVIASIGIAYGAFTYSRGGTYTSKLVAGDIYMRYKDNNKEINLENAMPSSSYTGGDYFEFEIIGKNTSTKTIYYELLLNHGDVPTGKTEENRIADEFLKFKLVEVNNDTEGNDLLTNTQIYTIDKERIYVGTIGTTNNYTKTYRLYCWIDNSLVIGEDYTQSEWNNLFASIGVDVKGDFTVKTVPTYTLITYNANEGVVRPSKKQLSTNATTYGELATPTRDGYDFDGWYTASSDGTKVESTTTYSNGTSATTLYAHWNKNIPVIDSCPGCKFMYSTTMYNYGGGESATNIADIPEGIIKEDYRDVITDDRKYFIGITQINGKIDRAFACGIKGEGSNNGVAFCLEGSSDNSTESINKNFLNNPVTGLWQGECGNIEENNNYWGCTGNINVMINGGQASVYAIGGYAYSYNQNKHCTVHYMMSAILCGS